MLDGQVLGSVPFSVSPGSSALVHAPIPGRTFETPEPPLDDVVVVLNSTDPRGSYGRVEVPLRELPSAL